MSLVWAIGSGVIPKSEDLFKTVEFIKSKFKGKSAKNFIWRFCKSSKYYIT